MWVKMHRWLHWLVGKVRKDEVLVVIWGVHSPDWMTALSSSAPVWTKIPNVKAVLNLCASAPDVPLCSRAGRRTVIIPLMEDHIAQCPRGYAALTPTAEALVTFSDKARFADYARRQGLSAACPATYPSVDDAVFPCVLKRTNLNNSQGVEIATSREHTRNLLAQEPFAGRPFIIQSLVPFQTEYVVHCVCIEGRIIWHAVYARDFPALQPNGAKLPRVLRGATITDSLLKQLEAFLRPLAYAGPCSVDCTWGEDEQLIVFEINPRFGGSLMRPEKTEDLAACLSLVIAHAR